MDVQGFLDTITRAAVYRAMHGVSPLEATIIAVTCVVVGMSLRRRR